MSVLQDAKHHATPSQTSDTVRLKHDPEKWEPVFRQDQAPLKNRAQAINLKRLRAGLVLLQA